jgi:ATP-dependent RNA helicase DDX3X
VTNSRWDDPELSGGNQGGGGGGGGGGDARGDARSGGGDARNGGGGGGGGGGRGGGLQWSGDTRPDPRLEKELFEGNSSTGLNFDRYDDIPVETSSGYPEPLCNTEFDANTIQLLGTCMAKNLSLCGYTKPTPVQRYSIPAVAINKADLLACAQTGSGKTGGFLLPVIANMIRDGPREPPPSNRRGRRITYPCTLVLAPTRELAVQIYDEARKFTYMTGVRAVVCYGGSDIRNQLRDMERGADLLVATPGRLLDIMERGNISLRAVRFLILDEADRMLDMGFEPQIRDIIGEMPDRDDGRQTLMFSATFPREVQTLAADFLRDYLFLSVGRVGSASKDVKQSFQYCDEQDKPRTLLAFLQTINEGLVLIFVERKRDADWLEDTLRAEGFSATSIHGDRTQREREQALKDFKSGTCPVMVATDVAARGLDINGVTQVVNYDMPSSVDDYVHRIGRTGRAGNTGNALAYLNERSLKIGRELLELLTENGQDVPPWLDDMCRNASGGGRYGGKGGKGKGTKGAGTQFGARDIRQEQGYRPAPQNTAPRASAGPPGGMGGGGGYEDDGSAW